MKGDSREKILADWNAQDWGVFDNFNSLYRFLKRSSKMQGKQDVTDELRESERDTITMIGFSHKTQLGKRKQNAMNQSAVIHTFRQRIKELNRNT